MIVPCANLLTIFQIDTLIRALFDKVVPLIQDLNGNHVIQKCLNKLTFEQAQVNYPYVRETIVADQR